jgi:ribonucleoside-triphosphate reductase
LTYADYLPEAQNFVWTLFDIYKDGDGSGRPFFFPKPLVHITERFFQTPGHEKFLHHICDIAAEKGNTYFVFDRGDTAKISECCRLSFKLEKSDFEDAKYPWKMRYSAMQNVTINLPRIAYEAKGDDTRLFSILTERLTLAAKAHLQKKSFIEKLLALGESGPLALLCMDQDGESYLRMRRVTYLIGMVGLNEMVQFHTGRQLHESDDAIKFGLKIIAHMNLVCSKLARMRGMRFVLEQTPAESTAYRFAKLDMKVFPEAQRVVKGCLAEDEIYYTNSTLFNVAASVDAIDRVKKEGLFHPLIEAGSLTHVWLGETRPSPESMGQFVKKTFKQTQNDQVAFSPELTSCVKCGRTSRGLNDYCPYCRSDKVEQITRITGYFTKVSSWNKGKIGELKERLKNTM